MQPLYGNRFCTVEHPEKILRDGLGFALGDREKDVPCGDGTPGFTSVPQLRAVIRKDGKPPDNDRAS
jgi:hypothetical protein